VDLDVAGSSPVTRPIYRLPSWQLRQDKEAKRSMRVANDANPMKARTIESQEPAPDSRLM